MRVKTELQAEKILDRAARLFGKKRFHEVRMDDIAEEARVGKGTLYRYFPDKEALYLELVKRFSEQYVCALRALEAGPGTPLTKLERLVATIIRYFDERPHLFDLIQRAEVLHHEHTPFSWLKAREDGLRIVYKLFELARQRGDFALRNPKLTAQLMLGSLRSVIRFGPFPRPPRLAQDIVAQFLFGGVRATNGRPKSGKGA